MFATVDGFVRYSCPLLRAFHLCKDLNSLEADAALLCVKNKNLLSVPQMNLKEGFSLS